MMSIIIGSLINKFDFRAVVCISITKSCEISLYMLRPFKVHRKFKKSTGQKTKSIWQTYHLHDDQNESLEHGAVDEPSEFYFHMLDEEQIRLRYCHQIQRSFLTLFVLGTSIFQYQIPVLQFLSKPLDFYCCYLILKIWHG